MHCYRSIAFRHAGGTGGHMHVSILCFTFCTSVASLYLMYIAATTTSSIDTLASVTLEDEARDAGPLRQMLSLETGKQQQYEGAVVETWLEVQQSGRLADALHDLILLQHQQQLPDSGFKFNVTRSDTISLDRAINDTRPPACKSIVYDIDSMPQATVVIPFYNEALSTLLRTIHSVLNRTPGSLLEQIILVDDFSDHAWLGAPLGRYVDLLPGVLLLRNKRREGLIRSRLNGLRASRAAVVVFLDAHTECNINWLPPLLRELQRNPRAIVQPFVDGIDENTLHYSKPEDIHKGGFTWDLRYVWMKVSEQEQRAALQFGQPFWSPTLVGCAIAVNRTSFLALGSFDADMEVWGGENIELAFRAWMCGGQVITVPCSRIGHLFRDLPYIDEAWQARWQKNLMRVADVWLGHYRRYFYLSTRVYPARRVNFTAAEMTSLQERIRLRASLKCRTFDWYLANVVPEMPLPAHDSLYHGEVLNYRTSACWYVMDDGYLAITFACFEHKLLTSNVFTLTADGLMLYGERCVVYEPPLPNLRVVPCPKKASVDVGIWSGHLEDHRWMQITFIVWEYGQMKTYCIHHVTSAVTPHKGMQMPQTAVCDASSDFQFWAFTYRFDSVM